MENEPDKAMEHDAGEKGGEADQREQQQQQQQINGGDFQVIGTLKRSKAKKVVASLPRWMSHCTKFDGDIETNCGDLQQFATSIDAKLLDNLTKNKIEKLFPVQKAVIPCLLESFQKLKYSQPRDICVLSPTGSGKTLAFVIPIVNHLLKRVVTQIRALVILPVSDLASQVHKVFQMACKGTSLRVGLATSSQRKGGSSNDALQFYRKSANGQDYICLVDILVATPGKLMDLIQHDNGFRLKDLEILVIDEADRMMNETQFHWLREIEFAVFESNAKHPCSCPPAAAATSTRVCHTEALAACSISSSSVPKKALYKVLFSATLNTDPEKLDHLCLYYPMLFNVSAAHSTSITEADPKQSIPANLKEYMVIAEKDKKPLIIWHLVKVLCYRQILCFTDSVESTHRLFQLMKQLPEIVVSEFSSKQNIKKRAKILSQFESGTINMIISTDIFARGLDVNGIECVVCYDPPRNETAYIHRIGRTARAGNEGTAISLVTPDQLKHFTIVSRRAHKSEGKKQQIERLNIRESDLKPMLAKYQKALKMLEIDVKDEGKASYLRKRRQIAKSKFTKDPRGGRGEGGGKAKKKDVAK